MNSCPNQPGGRCGFWIWVDAVFEQNSHQIQNNFGNDLKLACNLVNAAEKETFAKKYRNIRNFAQI